MRFHKITRNPYWSLSKPAIFLRTLAGIKKQTALSSQGWADHEKHCKEVAPFTYWITNDPLDYLQDVLWFIPDLLHSVKIFYKNWKGKTHILSGGLEVGQWYDLCTRVNTCLFSELEAYIEKEKTLAGLGWEKTLVYSEEWGYDLDHKLYGKPTNQALAAIEQEAIYDWWKKNKDRDFWKESGMEACYAKDTAKMSVWEMVSEKNPEKDTCRKLEAELESQFKKEEEEMLIRLIKIRDSLWS
jgi:hypothetical protein